MHTVHIVLAVTTALMVAYLGVAKLRQDPYVVKVIHEVVGVPLRWFPLLAACEFAGAVGLLAGLVCRRLRHGRRGAGRLLRRGRLLARAGW